MKKLLLALILSFLPTLALAQSQRNPCSYLGASIGSCVPVGYSSGGVGTAPMPVGGLATEAAPTFVEGLPGYLSFDLAGALRVSSSGGGGGAVTIADGADVTEGAIADAASTAGGVGTISAKLRLMTTQLGSLGVAQGSTTSGQLGPLIMGAVTTGLVSYTNAQTSPLSLTTQGLLRTTLSSGAVNSGAFASGAVSAGAYATGSIVDLAANAAIVSASAEGSHVGKASAGNLYNISITTGATPGYLMVFNATSAPADGAVTPNICRTVAANSSLSLGWGGSAPRSFSTGITAVFSTTGCFTKTISATAFFEIEVR